MEHFTAHRLRFLAEVQTTIELNQHQGSAIRGALFNVLRRQFCFQRQYDSCQLCPLHATCPVSFLLATVDDEGRRGADLPRPYTVEPPLGRGVAYEGRDVACNVSTTQTWRYGPGQPFEFGLTMFSRALNLFPYIILTAHALQQAGLGRKVEENGWRRGTFTLRQVWAENPLSGERQQVLASGDTLVHVPDVPITHEQIVDAVRQRPQSDELTVCFLTPTRLVDQGALVHRPLFRVMVQRLFERLSALARAYCDTPLELDFRGLLEQAGRVQLVEDGTRWVEWESYSTRRQASTPNSGFLGSATYRGELGPFLPWLLWGQFTHVGKDAVKGNGWYGLEQDAGCREQDTGDRRQDTGNPVPGGARGGQPVTGNC